MNRLLTIAFVLISCSVFAAAQGGLCSQRMADGKYHQVPCTYQSPQNPNPPSENPGAPRQPTNEQLDQQASERAKERLRKEKERKQQEDALKAAEEAAKQADFLKKRNEAVTDLKGVDVDGPPRLKEISQTDPCPPSRDPSVVDLCSPKNTAKVDEFKIPPDDAIDAEGLKVIKGILDLAKQLRWQADEVDRLTRALYLFDWDGETADTKEVRQTWSDIAGRRATKELLEDLRTAKGVTLSAAGKQSFNDCAIFALATSSGRPYGFVAALATKYIKDGTWRSEADRADPSKVIRRKRGGLIGGEVILLAEALGQAEIIQSKDFAKTVSEGRPVMISITRDDKDAHQIVLTKTFQHDGETWFETIDSNIGPFQKRYLSQIELGIVLLENGVAFKPEQGRTPKLLR